MEFKKGKREVVVYLPNCKVEGFVDLLEGASLTEWVIANPHGFVKVYDTYVTAIRAHESWKYRTKVMTINKDYVISMFSRKHMKPDETKKKKKKKR